MNENFSFELMNLILRFETKIFLIIENSTSIIRIENVNIYVFSSGDNKHILLGSIQIHRGGKHTEESKEQYKEIYEPHD